MKKALFSCFAVMCACCGCTSPGNVRSIPASSPIPYKAGLPKGRRLPGWALGEFSKVDSINPILKPQATTSFNCPLQKRPVHWEEKDVFNPAIVVLNSKVYMIYRAQDKIGKPGGTSRLGLATSTDGIHFRRRPLPVFYPSPDSMKRYEWQGGCEDPRIVQDSTGVYWMTYTAYDGKLARLAIAHSHDLIHWSKDGLAFGLASGGKYRDQWSKSGAIISRLTVDKLIAAKIQGHYWMYWGDDSLKLATSDDLKHWEPLLRNGKFLAVASPRRGMFDSRLCESGPPPRITPKGIVLVYNGMNLDPRKGGDPSLAEGTYSGGQLLIDSFNPWKVIDRLGQPFIKPDHSYETKGQVNQVCFLEGLAHFKGSEFLYYGTADSRIAVAVTAPVH